MLPHIFSGLKVYVLQKSYVKTESSRDGIGGGEAALGSDCVRRVDPSGMDLVPYKRPQKALSPLLPCEGSARKPQSPDQQSDPHGALNLLAPIPF